MSQLPLSRAASDQPLPALSQLLASAANSAQGRRPTIFNPHPPPFARASPRLPLRDETPHSAPAAFAPSPPFVSSPYSVQEFTFSGPFSRRVEEDTMHQESTLECSRQERLDHLDFPRPLYQAQRQPICSSVPLYCQNVSFPNHEPSRWASQAAAAREHSRLRPGSPDFPRREFSTATREEGHHEPSPWEATRPPPSPSSSTISSRSHDGSRQRSRAADAPTANPDADQSRRLRRRLQNRAACQRLRERRQNERDSLQAETERLRAENAVLRARLQRWEEERQAWIIREDDLKRFAGCV